MTLRITLGAILLVALTALITTHAVSEEKEPAAPEGAEGMSEQEMMKKWMEVATPGKAHEVLKKQVGKWNFTMRMWMAGPDQPATEAKGTAEITTIFGGRYLMQKTKGTMMGMPHEGLALTGYDNYKKLYTGMWIDNLGTAMLTMEGTLEKSGKVMNLYGKMDEWTIDQIGKMVHWKTEFVNEDKFIFTAYDLAVSRDYVAFQIEYDRAK